MDNGACSYRRFLDGDENGVVDIIRDYKDGLMLYLNGFVQNIHVAEDLTEDTFVKIVVNKPRFSGKSTFKTWLYAIGRNVTLDYIRRCKKVETVSTDDVAHILSDEADVEKKYIQNEQKRLVYNALKKLNPEYRQVLYLMYFEDFKIAQIASVMKKNNKQIENLVYRAKLSLKTELDKEGFVYEEL